MKFDMHCHTKEGSMDGKVPVETMICELVLKGFGGMLISDHNSYGGYREYLRSIKGKKYSNFAVLKGIEYDTIDAGHILVIMPPEKKLPILEIKGLPVQLLTNLVHRNGGILGPAHPCGERYLSFARTYRKKKQMEMMDQFDFVEAFNSCEDGKSNAGAKALAEKYHKPGFGGSDCHKYAGIGKGFTELPDTIRCEQDLIDYLHAGGPVGFGGSEFRHTTKDKLGPFNQILVQSFWFYNKFTGWWRRHKRKIELKKNGF